MKRFSKAISKPLITFFIVSLVSLFGINQSFAFFDTVLQEITESLLVGSWINLSETANPESVTELISVSDERIDFVLKQDNGRIITDITKFLEDYLYDQDTPAMLDEVFLDYTNMEILETIVQFSEFASDFLFLDESDISNPILVYPPRSASVLYSLIDLEQYPVLMPGDSLAIPRGIFTANLEQLINDGSGNYGITFSISLYSDSGTDISDFGVEILIDKNAFAFNHSYEYSYRYLNSSGSSIVNSKIQAHKNLLIEVPSELIYTTAVRNSQTYNYTHRYIKPSCTGLWSRFSTGPSITLYYPATFQAAKKDTVSGLYMAGSGNGSKITLDFSITCAYPIDGYLPFIPIQIILSRGTGSVHPNPENNMPQLSYRVLGYPS